ncbi:hypothetical protein [Streptomyces sp. AS58]|uniref:hypothetical protein n=1 Tax=Streptomyces sp. AS58 TaxID=1519489 RepID=UPI0006AEEAE9|nr:hypothetical protein [Streptomyces sp. AS58]
MNRFVGSSTTSIGGQIIKRLGEPIARLWEERFRDVRAPAVDEGLTPVGGITEAQDALETASLGAHQWCIASSDSHDKMRHTLGRVGLHECFEGRGFRACPAPRSNSPSPKSISRNR